MRKWGRETVYPITAVAKPGYCVWSGPQTHDTCMCVCRIFGLLVPLCVPVQIVNKLWFCVERKAIVSPYYVKQFSRFMLISYSLHVDDWQYRLLVLASVTLVNLWMITVGQDVLQSCYVTYYIIWACGIAEANPTFAYERSVVGQKSPNSNSN